MDYPCEGKVFFHFENLWKNVKDFAQTWIEWKYIGACIYVDIDKGNHKIKQFIFIQQILRISKIYSYNTNENTDWTYFGCRMK